LLDGFGLHLWQGHCEGFNIRIDSRFSSAGFSSWLSPISPGPRGGLILLQAGFSTFTTRFSNREHARHPYAQRGKATNATQAERLFDLHAHIAKLSKVLIKGGD
jgi:hypothetical protein